MNQHSKIAVVGYGVEGQEMLKYLRKHKFDNVTVCDQDVQLKKKMPDGISVRLGEHYLEGLHQFDVVFRSPGVPHSDPEFAKAAVLGTRVTSPTEFFLEQCPCTVIGVTGTKGKGTTSTLIYEILREHSKLGRKSVYLGGNIGNPPIEFLDKVKKNHVVVLELSCFQLGDLTKSPHIAVILNTTIDHLDYYPDRGAYMRAKELILTHQDGDDIAVLNADYPYVKYYKPLVAGRMKMVSVKGKKVKDGVVVRDGWVVAVKDGKEEKIVKVSDIALVGSHNLENVSPAVAVAREYGVSAKVIRRVVKKFRGLEHRIELMGKKKGVAYYNDSFSTNPMTSIAAIDSFEEPTFLIAGGSDKGLGYGEWAKRAVTKGSLKGVVLNGETAGMMKKALDKAGAGRKGSGMKVVVVDDLQSAFAKARAMAEAKARAVRKRKGGAHGAVVVMSPAAASFDQFKNYKERGKKFGKMV
jgi:UDP-N-acetylmuramoylalanine--D-glutamate ligase